MFDIISELESDQPQYPTTTTVDEFFQGTDQTSFIQMNNNLTPLVSSPSAPSPPPMVNTVVGNINGNMNLNGVNGYSGTVLPRDNVMMMPFNNEVGMMQDYNYNNVYNVNNIGYSYDMESGTYIPVTVMVDGTNDMSVNGTQRTKSYYVDDENKRPRKRKRTSKVDLPTPDKLTDAKMYEDSLLALDSQSFDEYVETAYRYKKYAEQEKEYFREIRKRIKNRESARKSRMNKRTKLDDLSGKVNELNEQTTQLQQENFNLKQENFRLQNEVIYLKNVINSQSSGFKPVKQETPTSSTSLNSHSIFLFVVLLSFGLLWNFDINIFTSNKFSSFQSKIIEDPLLNSLDLNLHNYNNPSDKTNNAQNHQHNYEDAPPTDKLRHYKKDVEICC